MRSHKEYINFKLTRNNVSYSNSFIFRSRCRCCGSKPGKTVARSPMGYEFSSAQEFHSSFEGYVPSDRSIRFPITSRYTISQMPFSNPALRINKFKADKNKYSKEEYWNRIVSCDCGMTWWSYKNMTKKHTPKFVLLNKI